MHKTAMLVAGQSAIKTGLRHSTHLKDSNGFLKDDMAGQPT
jgi:hypothetical protein